MTIEEFNKAFMSVARVVDTWPSMDIEQKAEVIVRLRGILDVALNLMVGDDPATVIQVSQVAQQKQKLVLDAVMELQALKRQNIQ